MSTLYVVAGEPSGDKHTSLVLQALRKYHPELNVKGYGGKLIHALYPNVEDWTDQAAIMGFVEVIKNISYFKRKFSGLMEAMKKDKPDVLLLVDYAGFNLRLAAAVKKELPNTKIICFISPQVWAWNKGRIPKIVKIIDLMLCIFPFEQPLFQEAGLETIFVGHPLVADIEAQRQPTIREENLLGLFPGSRIAEVDRHFPVYINVIRQMQKKYPNWTFVTAASSEKIQKRLILLAEKNNIPLDTVNIQLGNYHELMDRATLGLVASGTATMEAALHRLPYVLIYKTSPLTFFLAKRLVKINYIGMVNILSQQEMVKELIQDDFTPEKALAELEKLMIPKEKQALLERMQISVDKLGQGDAADKTAQAIAGLLNSAQH